MKQRRLTMKDLANAAGVSLGTASNAMAEKRSVSPELRERVRRVAAEIKYIPNAVAASLRRQSTRTIGLCIPNLANPFFSDLAQQLNSNVERDGYEVLIVETQENSSCEQEKMKALYAKKVDAIFSVPTASWSGDYNPDVPFVILDRIREHETLPSVTLDNKAAVTSAFECLHALGHRKIWMVVNAGELWNSTLRIESFKEAARGYGIEEQVRVVETNMVPREIAAELAHALLHDMPSAILSANGLATLGTLRALQDARIAIPDAVSLLAIDDVVWMDVLRPSISVVCQPVDQIAQVSWQMMKALLDGTPLPHRHVELPPTLVMRESTGVSQAVRSKMEP